MIQRSIAIAIRALVETVLPADCPACAGPLGDHLGGVCAACWRESAADVQAPDPVSVDGLASFTSLGPYEGRLRQIIRCLKFSDLPGLAGPLGDRLVDRLRPVAEGIDLVVPVPLHRVRRWRRGYNQAELIAERVARGLHRSMSPRALARQRATASQRGRTRAERVANVRGAFRAREGRLAGKGVLLIDDVVTTGATIAECARILSAAGAGAVHVAAAARTLSRIDT